MTIVGAAYAALGGIAIIYVVSILFRIIDILSIDTARVKAELKCVKAELKCVKDELKCVKAELKRFN